MLCFDSIFLCKKHFSTVQYNMAKLLAWKKIEIGTNIQCNDSDNINIFVLVKNILYFIKY